MLNTLKEPKFMLISGLVFLMIALVLPTKDRYVLMVFGQKHIITRADQPLAYWGFEAAVALASAALFAGGIYRGRKL